jgi:hypothetical protein
MTGAVAASLILCILMGASAEASDAGIPSQSAREQFLTGQVIAVWCHLREGMFGTGKLNNNKQINCIRLGSPIAIKVDKTFYLVSCQDQKLKSKLTTWAGYKVTVRGVITEEDHHPTIKVSHIERTRVP